MNQAESTARSFLGLVPLVREQLMKPIEHILRTRLSTLQYVTVTTLSRHRSAMMMSELAERLRISKQHLNAIVGRLIEQGSVRRSRDPGDPGWCGSS